MNVLVTGAGGFIGHHLVTALKAAGTEFVRGVDIKRPQFAATAADEFLVLDLRKQDEAYRAFKGVTFDRVYMLAADMGGMGFISQHHSAIMHNNLQININVLNEAVHQRTTPRVLFTSSACVYPEYRQKSEHVLALREEDAYPAQPQDAYGWEKLITERLCTHYREEGILDTRIVRFHNIFGPLGTWRGGREKAPAALCRKIAVAKHSGNRRVEIWGDGKQTRSFCYISDCVRGLMTLMDSDWHQPLNLGQDRMISINELARLIAWIADTEIELVHVPGPEGVRGRNSDNRLVEEVLGWRPAVTLEDGLGTTYKWIESQLLDSRV